MLLLALRESFEASIEANGNSAKRASIMVRFDNAMMQHAFVNPLTRKTAISALPGTGIKRSAVSFFACPLKNAFYGVLDPTMIDNHSAAPLILDVRPKRGTSSQFRPISNLCPAVSIRLIRRFCTAYGLCCDETSVPNLPGSLDHGRRTRL
jgi:hypothetical protein